MQDYSLQGVLSNFVSSSSVRSKRLRDVDARGACGRENRSDNRGGEDHPNGADEWQQPGQSYVLHIAANQARECEADGGARRYANHRDQYSFNQHVCEDQAWVSAKREADSKLAGAPTDRKGKHTGNPDDRNRQGQSSESAEYDRVQPIWREHFCADVFERRSILNRLLN